MNSYAKTTGSELIGAKVDEDLLGSPEVTSGACCKRKVIILRSTRYGSR